MKTKWIMLLLVLLLGASYAMAEDFKDVTSDELKKMIDEKEKMVLVDARSSASYKQGHIPTAINISQDKFSDIKQYLPDDKNLLLIFYCTGGKAG